MRSLRRPKRVPSMGLATRSTRAAAALVASFMQGLLPRTACRSYPTHAYVQSHEARFRAERGIDDYRRADHRRSGAAWVGDGVGRPRDLLASSVLLARMDVGMVADPRQSRVRSTGHRGP